MPAFTLPSADLGFDDLRERMSAFTVNFDEFIERGRKRLLEDKNEYLRTMGENRDHQKSVKTQLEDIAEKELQLKQQAEKEAEEVQRNEREIAETKHKKQAKEEYKHDLQKQILELKELVEKRKNEKAAERRRYQLQGSKNGPEVLFWEQTLGMRIKGMGAPDKIRIIFSNLSERKHDEECTFALDLSSKDYEVISTKPELPPEAVAAAVEKLNHTRDLTVFLVDMRRLFKTHAT